MSRRATYAGAIDRALTEVRLNSDAIKARIVDREPCVGCGVRRDKHDEFGCRKWRGG